jgi:hypothetical protein
MFDIRKKSMIKLLNIRKYCVILSFISCNSPIDIPLAIEILRHKRGLFSNN